MTQVNQDFEIYSGNSKTVTFTISDENGDPLNLTGLTVAWRARHQGDSSIAILKATGAGITVPTPANGQILVALVETDTATLSGAFDHEAELIDGSSNRTTVSTGTMYIRNTLKH